jgi:hypothetical protein
MTYQVPIRARFVACVCTLLFVLVLIAAFGETALAQAAVPPACDAKALQNCTPNSGDTAWMLTSVALVLMMTIPGLGLFYGGMVRKKNVGDTVMTSFAVTCLVTILFAVVTYSLAFRPGTPFVGGLDRLLLKDILSDIGKGGIGNPNPLAPTIPETVYICFQMTFAIITPALIAGAFAERMKFSAMLWFIGLWAIFVYAPIAHWVWGPDGFLSSGNEAAWVKVLDFAGGTVVHINAGVAGLLRENLGSPLGSPRTTISSKSGSNEPSDVGSDGSRVSGNRVRRRLFRQRSFSQSFPWVGRDYASRVSAVPTLGPRFEGSARNGTCDGEADRGRKHFDTTDSDRLQTAPTLNPSRHFYFCSVNIVSCDREIAVAQDETGESRNPRLVLCATELV